MHQLNIDEKMMIEELETRFEMEVPGGGDIDGDSECSSKCSPF